MHATRETAPATRPPGRETYLTFLVGDQSYCLPFLRVAEVRTLRNCTPVLEGPSYGEGIFPLHTQIVPLLDLRVRFGQPARFTPETRLIVAWVSRAGQRDRPFGLLVDRIENIVPIEPGSVDRTACLNFSAQERFLRGIARLNGTPTALLDLEELAPPLIRRPRSN